MIKIKPPRHIVWFHDRDVDLDDADQRKRYYEQVLTYGRAEDVAKLEKEEIRRLLPEMRLPTTVRRLWEDYLAGS